MQNDCNNYVKETKRIESLGKISYFEGDSSSSDSDADIFHPIGGENMWGSPLFLQDDDTPDVLGLPLAPADPTGEPRLQGPGVLRGVCIPLAKSRERRRRRRERNAQEGDAARGGRGSGRPSKSSAHSSRQTNFRGVGKALTVDDLRDDADYQR